MDTNAIVYQIVESPIGKFIAGATPGGCCVFEFHDRGGFDRIKSRLEKRYTSGMVKGRSDAVDEMVGQVTEYFEGKRKTFALQLDLKGTPFELAVWEELQKIPYGETRSYGDIAVQLGKPGAARAVGRANGANYLPIIIPCHRVIEADGSLKGYGGGLWRKKYLLQLEMKAAARPGDLFSSIASA